MSLEEETCVGDDIITVNVTEWKQNTQALRQGGEGREDWYAQRRGDILRLVEVTNATLLLLCSTLSRRLPNDSVIHFFTNRYPVYYNPSKQQWTGSKWCEQKQTALMFPASVAPAVLHFVSAPAKLLRNSLLHQPISSLLQPQQTAVDRVEVV
ncbi:hypothetical protein J6590_016730 [Homalodisca vitripennis]|nr:hypothetical protein J6590_016730 [Homalodisca vitripennis]